VSLRLTRRQVARYAAQELVSGAEISKLVSQLAEWLQETKSLRSSGLLIEDIKYFLAHEHDTLYAEVTTAHDISQKLLDDVTTLLSREGYATVVVDQAKDESLLGGLIVRTSDKELDASVARGIKQLKALTE
jgi:F0F1-type ATP synthase delta subunit